MRRRQFSFRGGLISMVAWTLRGWKSMVLLGVHFFCTDDHSVAPCDGFFNGYRFDSSQFDVTIQTGFDLVLPMEGNWDGASAHGLGPKPSSSQQ